MGKFEELIKQARDGDAEALNTLEKEFSGSNLREQQEAATKALQENEPFIRNGKFNSLKESLGVDLTLEDLKGIATEDLTEDLLRLKAEEKQEARDQFKLEQAQASGFDSVEEYDKALDQLKQTQNTNKQGLEALGGATASSSGGHTPPAEPVEPYDAALTEYEAAKKSGATQDVAIGRAAHELMAVQHAAPEEAL